MSKRSTRGQGRESRDEYAQAYKERWGESPGWLDHLAPPARARVLQVAVTVGMRLTDTDWHLMEDRLQPDLPLVRRLRGPGGGGAGQL